MKNKLLKTRNRKTSKDSFAELDLQSEVDSEAPKAKKPAREPKEPKGKGRKKKEQPLANPNIIQTSNKLIGDIERDDIYGDEELNFCQEEQHDLKKEELIFEEKPEEAEDKKSKPKFLMKMKTKIQQKEGDKDVAQSVVDLGFVKSIAQKISANQLAANGIQISMREKLLEYMQTMDKD